MIFFNRSLSVYSYLIAVFIGVAVPMGLGYIIFRTNPSACYDSPCLLPLLFMIVPPYAVPALAVFFAINRRSGALVPDGWLPTIAISGFTVQIAVSVFAQSTASSGVRDIFFSDLMSIPQGLIVGLTIGTAFWVALHVFGQRRTPP